MLPKGWFSGTLLTTEANIIFYILNLILVILKICIAHLNLLTLWKIINSVYMSCDSSLCEFLDKTFVYFRVLNFCSELQQSDSPDDVWGFLKAIYQCPLPDPGSELSITYPPHSKVCTHFIADTFQLHCSMYPSHSRYLPTTMQSMYQSHSRVLIHYTAKYVPIS